MATVRGSGVPEFAFVHPGVSIPFAVACALAVIWYWRRLGGEEVPESRRRIRRASMLILLVLMPVLVRALSYVDEQTPVEFVVAWGIVLLLVFLLLVSGLVDLWNNLRLHRRHLEEASVEHAARLMRAIRRSSHDSEAKTGARERDARS